MKFKVVVTSRDCYASHRACLASILEHMERRYDINVCIVDDASSDPRQPALDRVAALEVGVTAIVNENRLGAMGSQVKAIEILDPEPDDVLVWLDGDDRLPTDVDVFGVLDRAYADADLLVTYGSYDTDPKDPRCSQARPYPPECVKNNDYRNFKRWGVRYNHLRTMRFKVFDQLTKTDLTDRKGEWFMTSCDAAVMIPALELAGGRYRCLPERLCIYTSDNPQSDWRVHSADIRAAHRHIASIPPKEPLCT